MRRAPAPGLPCQRRPQSARAPLQPALDAGDFLQHQSRLPGHHQQGAAAQWLHGKDAQPLRQRGAILQRGIQTPPRLPAVLLLVAVRPLLPCMVLLPFLLPEKVRRHPVSRAQLRTQFGQRTVLFLFHFCQFIRARPALPAICRFSPQAGPSVHAPPPGSALPRRPLMSIQEVRMCLPRPGQRRNLDEMHGKTRAREAAGPPFSVRPPPRSSLPRCPQGAS